MVFFNDSVTLPLLKELCILFAKRRFTDFSFLPCFIKFEWINPLQDSSFTLSLFKNNLPVTGFGQSVKLKLQSCRTLHLKVIIFSSFPFLNLVNKFPDVWSKIDQICSYYNQCSKGLLSRFQELPSRRDDVNISV